MGYYFSKPTTAQQISVPLTAQQISVPPSIFTMNINLYFSLLAPFLDETSQSAFARTYKSFYDYLERLYAKKTAGVIYSPPDKLRFYIVSIKELQLRYGCLRLKFFPISKSQNNNCPVKILCFGECYKLSMLDELDCACVDALIIYFFGWRLPYFPSEKFTNLRSWTYESVLTNHMVEDDKLYYSSMMSLERISEHFCNKANGPLKIVENCAIIQDNPPLDCKLSDATPIKPSQLIRYVVGSYQVPEPPKMRGGELNLIPSKSRGLDKLEIKCHLSRGLNCFPHLLTNLRILTYHYKHIYTWLNLGSSLNKYLDILRLKSIMVLRIIDPNPNDKFMCILTEGKGIVLVELIGRGYSKPAQEIKLVPENSTVEYITLNQ